MVNVKLTAEDYIKNGILKEGDFVYFSKESEPSWQSIRNKKMVARLLKKQYRLKLIVAKMEISNNEEKYYLKRYNF